MLSKLQLELIQIKSIQGSKQHQNTKHVMVQTEKDHYYYQTDQVKYVCNYSVVMF